jgi:uncharacterized protein (DUF58 family)
LCYNPHVAALRLNSRLLPLLVAGLLALQILAPYHGWRFLLVGAAGAWLVSFLWARSLARGLRLQREMRFGWAQVGDRLEERFTLDNRSPLPALWVEVRDHSSLPGYSVSRVTGVGAGGSTRWTTDGVCGRRGLFHLGPTTIHTGDPLGIYSVTIQHPARADLLVTPPIVPLPPVQVALGGRSGEGRPRPDAPERTVSAAAVRQYAPGDSLRWVHWRTSARRDELFVRLFEGDPTGDWWIVLDVNAQTLFGKGQDSTEEHSIILAASLADRGLRLGRPVGLVINGEAMEWLPPQSGEGQRWNILRSLARAAPGQRSLGELLAGLRRSISKGASLVVITADTRSVWLEGLMPLLWRGAMPTVVLLDPDSFDPELRNHSVTAAIPPAARLAALLSEQGIACDIIPRELLDRPEARPGQRGRWKFRVSPTGRAITLETAQDTRWKALA